MTTPTAPSFTVASLISMPKAVEKTFRVQSQDPEQARLDLQLSASIDRHVLRLRSGASGLE